MTDPSIPRAAADGFGQGAAAYEAGRPSYPADAVAWLAEGVGIGPGRRIVDLAAGTGKLTRLLVPTGADLVAVEPVAAMRDQFRAAVPGVEVVEGMAEALPFGDHSVDGVVVAQAFHWFDLAAACREIRRVLRPGGSLGMIWNERDTSVPWVAELSRIIRWDERGRWQVPYTVEVDWAERFASEETGFGPLATLRTTYRQRLDADTLVARVLSTSYLASQDVEAQAAIADRVRALVAGFPDTFDLPYVTVAYLGLADDPSTR